MSAHWPNAPVHPMSPDRSRFQHVIKHLYRPAEHWEQVVDGGGAVARERALQAGCPRWLLNQRLADTEAASSGCRQQVLQDYDRLLHPACETALEEGRDSGRWGRLPEGGAPGWLVVGAGGVVVVLRSVDRQTRLEMKSAWRPIPRQGRSRADFFKEAVRKLKDRTSWCSEDT